MVMLPTLFFRRKSNTYLEPRYATNKHLRCFCKNCQQFLTACKRFLQKKPAITGDSQGPKHASDSTTYSSISSFMTEVSTANQWTGFYMTATSVMKELIIPKFALHVFVFFTLHYSLFITTIQSKPEQSHKNTIEVIHTLKQ